MAIALVSHKTKNNSDTTNVTTDAVDTSGANLLILFVSDYNYTPVAGDISDTYGNTWNVLTSYNTGGDRSTIVYAKNASVGSGHQVTFSRSGTYPSLQFLAFSGADTSAPFDAQNGLNSGTNLSSFQPGSVTPAGNDELFIFGATWDSITGVDTISVNSSFTIADQTAPITNNFGHFVAYKIQTTGGAENPTATKSSGSLNASAAIAAFKAAAGAALFIAKKNNLAMQAVNRASTY